MTAIVQIHEANGAGPVHTQVDGQHLNDGTDVRFATTDAVAPVATYPCVIPSSGFYYSYWKHLFLNIATGTGFTTINHIRFYTDGGISWTCGAGGGLFVGVKSGPDATIQSGVVMDTDYEQATGVEGTTGHAIDDITNGHTDFTSQGLAWGALTGKISDDVVHSTTTDGYAYECTTGGTTGAAEPSWVTIPGNTTTDGTVVWTCRAITALASTYISASPLLIDSTDYGVADDSDAILLQVKLFTDATQGTQNDETLTFTYDEI